MRARVAVVVWLFVTIGCDSGSGEDAGDLDAGAVDAARRDGAPREDAEPSDGATPRDGEADASSDGGGLADGGALVDGGTIEDTRLREGPVCSGADWCWETPLPAGGALSGIFAPAPGHVIASSLTYFFHVDPSGTIRHGPAPRIPYVYYPTRLWGAAPDDVWATGFPTGFYFDGVEWVEAAGLRDSSSIHGLARDDVWAASTAGVQHYDGTSWSIATTTFGFTDIWAIGPGEAVGVGHATGAAIVRVLRVDGTFTDLGAPSGFLGRQIYASSPDDVWAGIDGALHRRVDGEWTEVAIGLVTDIWGDGPDDVWIAMSSRRVDHWDGTTMESFTLDGARDVVGITGTSSADVWVGDAQGAMHHYDGTTWTAIKQPLADASLFAIAEGDDGDVWAVGNGVLARRAPSTGTWSLEASPSAALTGVARAGSQTFLFAETGAYRWQGSAWLPVTGGAGLYDACATEDGTIVGVGDGFARYVDGAWTEVAGPPLSAARIDCVGAEAFASRAPSTPARSATLHFDGDDFARLGLSIGSLGGEVVATHATADGDAWILGTEAGVGATNVVLRAQGNVWREVLLPSTTSNLYAIGGSGPSDVWLAGFGGRVRRWDGVAMRVLDAPSAPSFHAIHGYGDGTARAVAESGAVWEYDGGNWSEVTAAFAPGKPFDSWSLDEIAFHGDAIFAVGDTREALRWTSGAWEELPGTLVVEQVAAGELAGVWFADGAYQVVRWDGGAFGTPGVSIGVADLVVAGAAAYSVRGDTVTRVDGASAVPEHTVSGGILAFFGGGESSLWIAERVDTADPYQQAWRKEAGTWNLQPQLRGAIAFSRDPTGRVLAVASDLMISRREDGVFAPTFTPTLSTPSARDAHAYDVDDVWALSGLEGSPIHFDGTAWSTRVDPVGIGFVRMERTLDAGLYAVGQSASVIHRAPP